MRRSNEEGGLVQANSRLTMTDVDPAGGDGFAPVASVALDQLVSNRDVEAGAVREEIARSWRRSALSGLRPDRFDVPYEADVAAPDRLERAARPVLDRLGGELATTRVGLLLADALAHVVDRWVPDSSLRAQLDRILLARGFRYSEDGVGTNAIGTALEQQAPTVVEREEHFADALVSMVCAAAPITDPRSGRVFGVVDLTCLGADASPLMLPVATSAAREIEQRLVEDSSIAERVLLEHFLQARRRAKGPLVSLNQRTMITNPAASRMLHPSDQALLWDWASRSLGRHQPALSEIHLASGVSVAVKGEPVNDGGEVVGALIRFDQSSSARPQSGRRPTFGWDSLTDTERRVADLVAQGMTNRQAATDLFLSHHTVGFHLRQIFRKLDITSRVELTRLVILRDQQGDHGRP
jgi:transcriptional regulator of acetoin/glycerol metabolism/DNA-binding CsgD family transcriptional regulator